MSGPLYNFVCDAKSRLTVHPGVSEILALAEPFGLSCQNLHRCVARTSLTGTV